MPTLNWIGKDAVVNHHNQVPFRTLEKKYAFGEADSDNMIIHGDNLEALKSLLPKYEGRIKCIYIDPPYNTGATPENGGWIYDDNVNSPKIQKWLHDVFHEKGVTLDDLTRHDKWLCMMFPRLKLLQKLLSDDGAIFISIDDNEQSCLKLICDEIFGANNFLANFIWEKRTSRENRKVFSFNHDYIIAYSKVKDLFELQRGCLPYDDEVLKRYSNPDNDPRGLWQSVALSVQGGHGTKTQFYTITTPSGRKIDPPSGLCWRFTENKLAELIADKRITFGKDGNNVPRLKLFLNETTQGLTPHTLWKADEVETTDFAKKEILDIFDGESVFDTPKPTCLINRILQILSNTKEYIVLDSFAGSGTTAHAVLNLNKQDGGNRKFILVEMEDYAENITAERVKRVINGYGKDKNAVGGTDGGFTFYELGEPIFDADGYLNETVGVEKLREYIWYSETHEPYVGLSQRGSRNDNDGRLPQCDSPTSDYLLGNHNGTAYYFYYEPNRTTTLDKAFLNTISQKAEQYVIYADNCLLSESFMQLNHIVFKKIPRDIRKF